MCLQALSRDIILEQLDIEYPGRENVQGNFSVAFILLSH